VTVGHGLAGVEQAIHTLGPAAEPAWQSRWAWRVGTGETRPYGSGRKGGVFTGGEQEFEAMRQKLDRP